MITSGLVQPTPWNTYREEDEPQLAARYEAMIALLKKPTQFRFQYPCSPLQLQPPDEAPELDENLRPKYAGNALKATGSKALRTAMRSPSHCWGFTATSTKDVGLAHRQNVVHQIRSM